MATVTPFHALRFNTERVGDLGAVWAPPYDVITSDLAAELRDRHPNNIVRITNPEGDAAERYTAASGALSAWIAQGVLVEDDRPSLYVHRHQYRLAGAVHQRTGVWALLKLEPFENGVVLPHERTMSGPKADRLALMRACRAQLSSIFFISTDPAGRIRAALEECGVGASQAAEFPAGERHEIFRVRGEAASDLAALFSDQVALIADGHHRYETALAYRDELIAGGAKPTGAGRHHFLMAYLVPEGDPGLQLLPTHRIVTGERIDWSEAVERVGDRFEVQRLSAGEVGGATDLLEGERGRPTFLLLRGDEPGGWLLRLRAATGDVPEALASIAAVAFHEVFLPRAVGLEGERQADRVSYTRDPEEALSSVRSGAVAGVAMLAPPSVAQVRAAAEAGERTPPKTTFFWPKVPTGVAIHLIDPNEAVIADE